MDRLVRDVMADVKVRLAPDTTLRAAAVELAAARTGLAVVDTAGGGVLTERDVLRAIADATDLDSAQVGDHMTADPIAVAPETPLGEACDLMIERGVRHLLVSEDGSLVGVLNMRDVVGVLSGAAALGAVPPARGG
ncbi:MAG: cyclic nucleotide-binding/CBS domain-containing protein [Thermoleophilia bacterium]